MFPKYVAPNRRSTGFLLALSDSPFTSCPGAGRPASLSSSVARRRGFGVVAPIVLPGHHFFSDLLSVFFFPIIVLLLICCSFVFGVTRIGCPLVIRFFYCTPKSSLLILFSRGTPPCRSHRTLHRGDTAGGNAE